MHTLGAAPRWRGHAYPYLTTPDQVNLTGLLWPHHHRPVHLTLSPPTDPLHRQVYNAIWREIASGVLAPGERLPAERELSKILSVSRVTVRRALQQLLEAGLVESHSSRGWYVSGVRVGEPANVLMGLTELGASRGLAASARVLSREVRPATIEEGDAFGIAPGAEVFDLQRLRLLDDIPIALDRSCLPLSRVQAVLDVDFSTASLYETLDACGVGPIRADYTVEAGAADAVRAELLGVAEGAPVLITGTAAYDARGRLVELAMTIYRSDRYRFAATLTRLPSAALAAAEDESG